MLGKAIDAHFIDVGRRPIRDIAMRMQEGGVGFYPIGNTPWVHIDSGSVRYWPRMSRDAMARLFPDGKTVFIPVRRPADGRLRAGQGDDRGARRRGADGELVGRRLVGWLFGGARGGGADDEEESGGGARVIAGGRGGGHYNGRRAVGVAPHRRWSRRPRRRRRSIRRGTSKPRRLPRHPRPFRRPRRLLKGRRSPPADAGDTAQSSSDNPEAEVRRRCRRANLLPSSPTSTRMSRRLRGGRGRIRRRFVADNSRRFDERRSHRGAYRAQRVAERHHQRRACSPEVCAGVGRRQWRQLERS